ncbi:MAG: O-antigen ligase family protein [Gammaproteobacteria bacterium]|nr:O-antigen ligase family protein [Gammaproteobacteria bacterium]
MSTTDLRRPVTWLLGLLLLFPVLSLVVSKAASVIFTLLALAGIYLGIRRSGPRIAGDLLAVRRAFASYFLVGLVLYLILFIGDEHTELATKLLGRDIRFLVAGLVLVAIAVATALPLASRKWLDASFIAGGLLVGLVAIAEVMLASGPAHRASGASISILFGHLSAAFAISLGVLGLHRQGQARFLFFLAAFMAVVAVILSGTRGAVLSLCVLALLAAVLWNRLSVQRWLVSAGLALLVTTALWISPAGQRMGERLAAMDAEFSASLAALESSGETAAYRTLGCVSDPVVLQGIVRRIDFIAAALEGTGVATVSIPAAEAPVECSQAGQVLQFTNGTRTEVGARMPAAGYHAAGRTLRFLARGQGKLLIQFSGKLHKQYISGDEWQAVEFGPLVSGRELMFVDIPSQQSLQLLPIRDAVADYRFAGLDTSVGLRLQLWRSAIEAFLARPLLGLGPGGLRESWSRAIAAGEISARVGEFDHAHGEILTVAAERGIPGLLSLLAVYAAPFWLFWRRRDAYGRAGMAFIGVIFISGLTETIFNHSLGITYYSMMVLILATAPREGGLDRPLDQASPAISGKS